MVACALGNACTDNLSPAIITCIGCNASHHSVCLGLPRISTQHLEHILSILGYVCDPCKGITLLDLINEQRKMNAKIDKIDGKIGKKDAEFMINMEVLAATIDDSAALLKELKSLGADMKAFLKDIPALQYFLNDSLMSSAASIEEKLEHMKGVTSSLSEIRHGMTTAASTLARVNEARDISEPIFEVEPITNRITISVENGINATIDRVLPDLIKTHLQSSLTSLQTLNDEIDCASSRLAALPLTVSVSPESVNHHSLYDELIDPHRVIAPTAPIDAILHPIGSVDLELLELENLASLFTDFEKPGDDNPTSIYPVLSCSSNVPVVTVVVESLRSRRNRRSRRPRVSVSNIPNSVNVPTLLHA